MREPKSLACPNLEGRFLILGATRVPVSRSKGESSGSPGPLILTHIVRHIFWMARPTNFKLGTRMDDDPHQPQAPWSSRSKIKVTRSRDQSEPCWPMLAQNETNSRSIAKIDRRVPRDTCYIAHQLQGQEVKVQGHRPTDADTHKMCYIFRMVRPKNFTPISGNRCDL